MPNGKRTRDYAKEYRQRNARAKKEGFSNYRDKRRAIDEVRSSRNLSDLWAQGNVSKSPGRGGRAFKDFVDAFVRPGNPIQVQRAKRKWFVVDTDKVSQVDWDRLYATSNRARRRARLATQT